MWKEAREHEGQPGDAAAETGLHMARAKFRFAADGLFDGLEVVFKPVHFRVHKGGFKVAMLKRIDYLIFLSIETRIVNRKIRIVLTCHCNSGSLLAPDMLATRGDLSLSLNIWLIFLRR